MNNFNLTDLNLEDFYVPNTNFGTYIFNELLSTTFNDIKNNFSRLNKLPFRDEKFIILLKDQELKNAIKTFCTCFPIDINNPLIKDIKGFEFCSVSTKVNQLRLPYIIKELENETNQDRINILKIIIKITEDSSNFDNLYLWLDSLSNDIFLNIFFQIDKSYKNKITYNFYGLNILNIDPDIDNLYFYKKLIKLNVQIVGDIKFINYENNFIEYIHKSQKNYYFHDQLKNDINEKLYKKLMKNYLTYDSNIFYIYRSLKENNSANSMSTLNTNVNDIILFYLNKHNIIINNETTDILIKTKTSNSNGFEMLKILNVSQIPKDILEIQIFDTIQNPFLLYDFDINEYKDLEQLEINSESYNQKKLLNLINFNENTILKLKNINIVNVPIDNLNLKNLIYLKELTIKFSNKTLNNIYNIILNDNIEYIYINNINLNLQNFENYKNIKTIVLDNNDIKSLDLTNLEKLETIEISNNLISKIDLTKNLKLKNFFSVNNINLKEINLKNNMKLWQVKLVGKEIQNVTLPTKEYMQTYFEELDLNTKIIKRRRIYLLLELCSKRRTLCEKKKKITNEIQCSRCQKYVPKNLINNKRIKEYHNKQYPTLTCC